MWCIQMPEKSEQGTGVHSWRRAASQGSQRFQNTDKLSLQAVTSCAQRFVNTWVCVVTERTYQELSPEGVHTKPPRSLQVTISKFQERKCIMKYKLQCWVTGARSQCYHHQLCGIAYEPSWEFTLLINIMKIIIPISWNYFENIRSFDFQ